LAYHFVISYFTWLQVLGRYPLLFSSTNQQEKGIYGCKHLETDNLPKDRKVNPRYFTGILIHFYLLPYPLGVTKKKLPGTRFPRYFLLKIA
jgi:hypothetical protein